MMDGVYEVDVLVGRDEGLLALDQAHVRPHVDGADALAGCITGSDAVIAPVASDGPDAFMIKVEFKKDPTAATPIEDVSFRGELEGRIIDTAGLPRRGKNAHEVASVVVCSDFECPFCDRARDTIEELVDTHETVAVFHLNFPLDSHPNAVLKAKAALAAHQQGAFWAMYDALFDRPELTTRADLVALASELELDRERFAVDLDSEATEASVRQQRQTCEALGANATPTYFVNGRKLQGALPVERLSEVLAKDLPE
jgi:protein-disulfide isomerase